VVEEMVAVAMVAVAMVAVLVGEIISRSRSIGVELVDRSKLMTSFSSETTLLLSFSSSDKRSMNLLISLERNRVVFFLYQLSSSNK